MKVTERLRTRSISKETNKSGDQLPTAQEFIRSEKKDKQNMKCLERHMPNMW